MPGCHVHVPTTVLCLAMQLAQSLRAIQSTPDPRTLGLNFTIAVDHLGQSVDVPLGGRPGFAAGSGAGSHA